MRNLRCFVWSAFFLAILGVTAHGCAENDCVDDVCNNGVNPEYAVTRSPLAAYCQIAVQDFGTVDMETDYVPNVTACENGNAGDQAIRAQAVSARSHAYYKISTGGTPIRNSTADQVYKCSYTTAATRHYEAAADTAGLVLMYKGRITAGFYVSGSRIDTAKYPDCVYRGKEGDSDWVSQQRFVTYNEGKSGTAADGFRQTTLGWVNDNNYANRGCMAQNGAQCLDVHRKYDYLSILKFFYGADIAPTWAEGTCIKPKVCETVVDKSGAIIDDLDNCFSRTATNSWYEVNAGYAGHLYYTYVWDKAAESVGTWTLNVTRPGQYEIEVYIQGDVGALSEKAPYVVRASGREHKVVLNLQGKSGWVSLGDFALAAGGDQWVSLSDASGEPYTDSNGKRVVFDAIRLVDAATCVDACALGDSRCDGDAVKVCGRAEEKACLTWLDAGVCEKGTVCTQGECIEDEDPGEGGKEEYQMPASCLTSVDGRESVIIDDLDPCFVRSYSMRWSELFGVGHNGHLYYAYVTDGMPSAIGTWFLRVTKSGRYSIYAYVDSRIGHVSNRAPYTVRASGQSNLYGIDLAGKTGWFKIGDYDLAENRTQYVQLMDASGEVFVENEGKRIVFDAIQVVPYGTKVEGDVDGGKEKDPGKDPGKDPEKPVDPSLKYADSGCGVGAYGVKAQLPWFLLGMAGLGYALARRRRGEAGIEKVQNRRK